MQSNSQLPPSYAYFYQTFNCKLDARVHPPIVCPTPRTNLIHPPLPLPHFPLSTKKKQIQVIKSIIREIVAICAEEGHVVHDDLAAFMVKSVVLNPTSGFKSDTEMTKEDIAEPVKPLSHSSFGLPPPRMHLV